MNIIIEAETAKLAGLQIDALQKLRGGQLSLFQFEWWINLSTEERTRIIAEPHVSSHERNSPVSPTLTPLYQGEKITVGETDGTETIAEATDVFDDYLDPDFKRWKTDQPSKPTVSQDVTVYELQENATFAKMFGSLGNLDTLMMTQGQIKKFCHTHRDKLRQNGCATFFLFQVETEKGLELFVACVRVGGRGLGANIHLFVNSLVWNADGRRRVVVPQLEPSGT